MNKQPEKKVKRWPPVPRWLGEEWVLQALLGILVLPVAFHTVLSTGSNFA